MPREGDPHSERKDSKGLSPWWLFTMACLFVFGLWGGWLWLAGGLPGPEAGPPERGQFGDAFGVLNALFAGLAFAGVIAALVMQMQELRLQRRELELY